MPHLPSRVVMDARHYARHGVKVAELARLYGCRRDTLSRAIHGHTHADLVTPDSYRPSPLPKREPEPPRKRPVRGTPWTPEERQALIDRVTGKKPKPAALSPAERLAEVQASGRGFTPESWAKYIVEWAAGQRMDAEEARQLKLARLRAQPHRPRIW